MFHTTSSSSRVRSLSIARSLALAPGRLVYGSPTLFRPLLLSPIVSLSCSYFLPLSLSLFLLFLLSVSVHVSLYVCVSLSLSFLHHDLCLSRGHQPQPLATRSVCLSRRLEPPVATPFLSFLHPPISPYRYVPASIIYSMLSPCNPHAIQQFRVENYLN